MKKGYLAGKIRTVIDLVTRLPIEIWFHTNPCASDTNFETVLLNLLSAKTLIFLDRSFYHFKLFEQLINQNVNFITRLKAKASIKVLKVVTYDYSIERRIDLTWYWSRWRSNFHFMIGRNSPWDYLFLHYFCSRSS